MIIVGICGGSGSGKVSKRSGCQRGKSGQCCKHGKMFYGVGNSSRGKSALPLFIAYLQTIDPSYNMEFEWQQPKNNKIFDQLTADSLKTTGTFSQKSASGSLKATVDTSLMLLYAMRSHIVYIEQGNTLMSGVIGR